MLETFEDEKNCSLLIQEKRTKFIPEKFDRHLNNNFTLLRDNQFYEILMYFTTLIIFTWKCDTHILDSQRGIIGPIYLNISVL